MVLLVVATMIGIAAIATPAAAQAQYVKICDAYGAGWFYIPGTDTCVNTSTGETRVHKTDGIHYGETEVSKDAHDAVEGVALSLALPRATVTPGHRFAAAVDFGAFEGMGAIGVGGAFAPNDNVTLEGNVGIGLQRGTVGGTAGVNISW
jgi:hypothetical protein